MKEVDGGLLIDGEDCKILFTELKKLESGDSRPGLGAGGKALMNGLEKYLFSMLTIAEQEELAR
jgi:hypothetical protein